MPQSLRRATLDQPNDQARRGPDDCLTAGSQPTRPRCPAIRPRETSGSATFRIHAVTGPASPLVVEQQSRGRHASALLRLSDTGSEPTGGGAAALLLAGSDRLARLAPDASSPGGVLAVALRACRALGDRRDLSLQARPVIKAALCRPRDSVWRVGLGCVARRRVAGGWPRGLRRRLRLAGGRVGPASCGGSGWASIAPVMMMSLGVTSGRMVRSRRPRTRTC